MFRNVDNAASLMEKTPGSLDDEFKKLTTLLSQASREHTDVQDELGDLMSHIRRAQRAAAKDGAAAKGGAAASSKVTSVDDETIRHVKNADLCNCTLGRTLADIASLTLCLSRRHAKVAEQLRQVKAVNKPGTHVPSRRSKIIAKALKPTVTFEHLQALARRGPGQINAGGAELSAVLAPEVPPGPGPASGGASGAGVGDTGAAAASASSTAPTEAASTSPSDAVPGTAASEPAPVATTARTKRTRGDVPVGAPTTTHPAPSAAEAAAAAAGGWPQYGVPQPAAPPAHPGRSQAEQEAKVQAILAQRLKRMRKEPPQAAIPVAVPVPSPVPSQPVPN